MNNDLVVGLLNEHSIAIRYAQKFGFQQMKMDIFDDFDFTMCRNGKVYQWLEIKVRDCNSFDFKDTMVPIRKVIKGLDIIRKGGNAFLLIQWKDKTGMLNFTKPFSRIDIGGRVDRGVNETQPYAYYKVSDFEEVEL